MRPFNWTWEHKAFLSSWAGRLHRCTPWPVYWHWDICHIFSDPLCYLTSRITDNKSLPILQPEVVVWQSLQMVVFTDFFPFTLLDKINRRWKKEKKSNYICCSSIHEFHGLIVLWWNLTLSLMVSSHPSCLSNLQ